VLKNTGNIRLAIRLLPPYTLYRYSFNLQTELPMWSNPFAFSRPGLGAAVPPRIPSSRPVMRPWGAPGARPPAFRGSGKETEGCAFRRALPGGSEPPGVLVVLSMSCDPEVVLGWVMAAGGCMVYISGIYRTWALDPPPRSHFV
jgi:hypothetical protein